MLVTSTYDEARPSYLNVGKLTTSRNSAATHRYNWRAAGNVTRQEPGIDGKTHVTVTAVDSSHKAIWKYYDPNALYVGSNDAPWTYTANGDLYAIPGYITSIAYEADGQTKSIAYANGVTAIRRRGAGWRASSRRRPVRRRCST